MDNDNMIKKAFDSVRLPEEDRQRVLDRLVAEENKEPRITVTDTKKERKNKRLARRSVGMIAAACIAAVMSISAGAYAIGQFINRQNVDGFMGEGAADKLEAAGLVINDVRENEHIRLTFDTLLSDGENACLVFMLEALDFDTHKLLKQRSWSFDLCYADTGEPCKGIIKTSYGRDHTKEGDLIYSKKFELNIAEADVSRPMQAVNFTLYAPQSGERIETDLFDGFEFELDLSKNVDTAVLVSESGNELIMSPFAIWGSVDRYPEFFDLSGEEIAALEGEYSILEGVSMIRADGTLEQLPAKGGTMISCGKADDGSNFFYFTTPTFYDLDDYIGVEIEGVQYLKK